MLKLDNIVDNKVLQNIFLWLCLFLIFLAINSENSALVALIAIGLIAPPVYITNLLILPYFKKKPIIFTLILIVTVAFFSFISVKFINLLTENTRSFWSSFINFFGVILLAVGFGMAIKLTRDSFTRRQKEKEAELKLLKAQLNPHFLFNTLNNLYGLSVVKSDKLPNLMLKLSDLLRYSLYETKDVFVPLTKEVEYLKNYISLEKIRLENTEINFTVNGKIDEKEIAPMLFIVFVENAFKHLSSEKSKVDIAITVEKNTIHFSCKNTVDNTKPLEENLEKGKSGIGLTNAKKRLELIYTDKHQLKINNDNSVFSVDLLLKI